MKNCKQMFTSNVRKCGYLKVGRSLLKTLFQGDMEQQQLSRILLCVQTFAYFSEGQVCTDEGTYICRPGEWITTYLEISRLTNVERHQVKSRLNQLESMHVLTVGNIGSYKRIRLTNYEQPMPSVRKDTTTPAAAAAEEKGASRSIFAEAGSFYSAAGQREGGVL